jgi:hypothetical protein
MGNRGFGDHPAICKATRSPRIRFQHAGIEAARETLRAPAGKTAPRREDVAKKRSTGRAALLEAARDKVARTTPAVKLPWPNFPPCQALRAHPQHRISQPSDGRITQNRTPLLRPTCLGAQT